MFIKRHFLSNWWYHLRWTYFWTVSLARKCVQSATCAISSGAQLKNGVALCSSKLVARLLSLTKHSSMMPFECQLNALFAVLKIVNAPLKIVTNRIYLRCNFHPTNFAFCVNFGCFFVNINHKKSGNGGILIVNVCLKKRYSVRLKLRA
jgi:hypothetical protein